MKLLLDTHLLLWAAGQLQKLTKTARELIENPQKALFFSAASIWEIIIKNGLGRAYFQVDVSVFRRGLLDNGYAKLTIKSKHAIYVKSLPPIHIDPFDRMLIAQSSVEGIILLTSDATVLQYAGSIRQI